MKEISNKINNILIVEGTPEKLLKFEEELKAFNTKIHYVPYTGRNTKNLIKQNLEAKNKNILCYTVSKWKLILFFNNTNFEKAILKIIENLKLNAQYNVHTEQEEKVLFLKCYYKKGLVEKAIETKEYRIKSKYLSGALLS